MSEATQQGAEPTIHEQLMAKLDPEPIQEPAPAEPEADSGAEQETEVPQEAVEETPSETPPEGEEEEVVTEPEGTEQPQIELSDLAEYLGMEQDKLDVDDDGHVLIRTKIDGEEGFAKLDDLVKSHQLEGHLNKQNMEVVEKQKALDAKAAELDAQVQQKVQEAENIIQLAWSELNREQESVDWNELRTNDPAEYAARQADFNQRQTQLANAYQQMQAKRQETTLQAQSKLEAQIQTENQKLTSAIDGWTNPETAQKEYSEIMTYLQSAYGFDPEDLYGKRENGVIVNPGIIDHRSVVMARKAMLFDQLQQSKPAITKKVRKAPKIVKAGTPKVVDPDAVKKKELLDRVKKTGGKQGSVADFLIGTGRIK